nr:unnamed protein product [Callosobruchus chinensis]
MAINIIKAAATSTLLLVLMGFAGKCTLHDVEEISPLVDQMNSTAGLASAYPEQVIAMAGLNVGTVSMKLIALEVTMEVPQKVCKCLMIYYHKKITVVSLISEPHASRQIFTATTVSVSRIPKDATVSGIARMALTN